MIGKTISHFKVLEKIGEGGMGVVYKAEDVKLNRTVALKIPPLSVIQDKDKKARFFREAQTCAALDHPNITRIFEVDEFEGQDFICMEFVDGNTLTKTLKEGPLEIKDVVEIAIQVCSALSQAHVKNIIHRDIKPDNIMMTEGGEIKVMDFGIAKFMDTVTLTKEGEILGTVAYMSPQQAVGDEIDFRSDIFSLGAVLYELLTGKLPFTGEQPIAIVYSLLNEEPLRIRELRDDVPTELEQIVFKALRKDPRERYRDISEMQKDIESFRDFLEGKKGKELLELVATEGVFREPREELRSDLVGRNNEFELLQSMSECFDAKSSASFLASVTARAPKRSPGAPRFFVVESEATMEIREKAEILFMIYREMVRHFGSSGSSILTASLYASSKNRVNWVVDINLRNRNRA